MTEFLQCIGEDEMLAFLAGKLSPERTRACQAHLESCPDCSYLAADGAGSAGLTGPSSDRTNVCAFRPDQLIGGRYRIVKFLARGGMGEVYEAEDVDLRERVALKTIAAAISDDPKAAARLRIEVQVARRVTHPNVCRIFDLGHHLQNPETSFLTMELLRGETLGSRIRRLGQMELPDAEAVAWQIAMGLDAAHAADVMHRDLKSDNIMLTDGAPGRPLKAVIMDFGLARPTAEVGGSVASLVTLAGIGTVGYMAPEQVSGGAVTKASDVYAFGVVLFEMFTGSLPFIGASPLVVAAKRLTDPPRLPRTLRSDLSESWEAVILRCLARDPAGRFATAGAAMRAAQQPSPSAVRATQPTTGARSSRRRWALPVLIGVAAAVLTNMVADRRPGEPPERSPTSGTVKTVPHPPEGAQSSADLPAPPAPEKLESAPPASAQPEPIRPALAPHPRTKSRRPPIHRPSSPADRSLASDGSPAPPTPQPAPPTRGDPTTRTGTAGADKDSLMDPYAKE